MPNNHTPNYQLSQWEPDDRVLMEDFNADNAKIDAALRALQTTVSAKVEIVTGTYVGDGATNQYITLGRRPKAVYVCSQEGVTYGYNEYRGGLALDGSNLISNEKTFLNITNTGFAVHYIPITNITRVNTNGNGVTYHYMAFF